MKRLRIVISGGGTGGHIFPALAIASEIKRRYSDAELLFVGALGKMEMQQVPKAGFVIKGLWIDGFQRSLSLRNLLFPIKLLVSLGQAMRILWQFRPQAVVGTGGFASGVFLKIAQWRGLPTLIQEQNSYPGITNKLLGQKAQAICVGFEEMERFFPQEKIIYSGNPVRKSLTQISTPSGQAKAHFELNETQNVVAVLGGSLGARKINELIASKLEFLQAAGYQILWQCGKLYYDQYGHLASKTVKIMPFVSNMESFYAAADILIARAGAGTLAELCCVAKPVILIPSPNVTANHQVKNASALVAQQAALMLEEKDLERQFEPQIISLTQDAKKQEAMRNRIAALAKPNATAQIVDELEKILFL